MCLLHCSLGLMQSYQETRVHFLCWEVTKCLKLQVRDTGCHCHSTHIESCNKECTSTVSRSSHLLWQQMNGVLNHLVVKPRKSWKRNRLSSTFYMLWTFSHIILPMDRRIFSGNKRPRICTHPEIMNDLVERSAEVAFHRATQLYNFIGSDYIFKKLQIKHNKTKLATFAGKWTISQEKELLWNTLQNLAGSAGKTPR